MSAVPIPISSAEEARQNQASYNDLMRKQSALIGDMSVIYGVDSEGANLQNKDVTFQGLLGPTELRVLSLKLNGASS